MLHTGVYTLLAVQRPVPRAKSFRVVSIHVFSTVKIRCTKSVFEYYGSHNQQTKEVHGHIGALSSKEEDH